MNDKTQFTSTVLIIDSHSHTHPCINNIPSAYYSYAHTSTHTSQFAQIAL